MRRKDRAVLDQIRQLNGGLHWNKVEGLLRSLGAEISEGKGSSVRIALEGEKLIVHRPHPEPECGTGLVKRVRELLARANLL